MRTRAASLSLAILWVLFVALYVACKVHFVASYLPGSAGPYLRQHSLLWIAMAAVAFLIWLTELIATRSKR